MTMAMEAAARKRSFLQAALPPERGLAAGNDQFRDADISLLCKQVMHDVRGDLVTLAVMAKLLKRGSFGTLPDNITRQMGVLEKRQIPPPVCWRTIAGVTS